MRRATVEAAVLLAAALGSAGAPGQVQTALARASVSSAGQQAAGGSRAPRLSASGRCVAFASFAFNLDPVGTGGWYQAFVRDLELGVTELVSQSADGEPGDEDGGFTPPAASDDCRFVAFDSTASNLVPGDTNGRSDVFLRDRMLGTTTLVSAALDAAGANGDSWWPAISGDGAWVVFASGASNLVVDDGNDATDVFLWQRATGEIRRLVFDPDHDAHHRLVDRPSIARDGRRIAVESLAALFDVPEENGFLQIWVVDRIGFSGTLVSRDASGAGDGDSSAPSLSDDGLWVTFESKARSLDPACSTEAAGWTCVGIFRAPAGGGSAEAMTPATADGSSASGGVSAHGTIVSFASDATNLVGDDDGLFSDVYLGGPGVSPIVRVSSSRFGGPANGWSQEASASGDGRRLAFLSFASDLVEGDTNLASDVFVTEVAVGIFADGFESGNLSGWTTPDDLAPVPVLARRIVRHRIRSARAAQRQSPSSTKPAQKCGAAYSGRARSSS